MIRVVSFDIFMTLADLDSRVPHIWRRITGRELDREEAFRYGSALRQSYIPGYRALGDSAFITMREFFHSALRVYFARENLPFDPSRAVDVFLEEHNSCDLYPEAVDTIQKLGEKYKIVLSSDADHDMVRDLLPRIPHSRAFVSEGLRAYKSGRSGAFFKRVVAELGVEPREIIHIGDARGDVNGAKAEGLSACLMDRAGAGWDDTQPYKPDYVIRTLDELLDIL